MYVHSVHISFSNFNLFMHVIIGAAGDAAAGAAMAAPLFQPLQGALFDMCCTSETVLYIHIYILVSRMRTIGRGSVEKIPGIYVSWLAICIATVFVTQKHSEVSLSEKV